MDFSQARPFQGEAHQAFTLPGGRPAALLIHGFPGTPFEMRPLAEALNGLGYTTQALLLPGFGAQIETLFDRDHSEWREAVRGALIALQQEHSPVIVVGYSMGAALAVSVAQATPPDALLMYAPFWKLTFGGIWRDRLASLLWPALKVLFRRPQPFKNVNFDDPQVRHSIANFMPGVEIDDPQVQAAIRQMVVPPGIFDQLRQTGRKAWQAAPSVGCPMLMIQGLQDEVANPLYTRQLLKRFRCPVTYHAMDGSHEIIHPQHPWWPAVWGHTRSFLVEQGLPHAD